MQDDIDDGEVIRFTQELVRISSPVGEECAIGVSSWPLAWLTWAWR